jgi:hypothetical protein
MSERKGGKEDHSVEVQCEKIACAAKEKKEVGKMSIKEYRQAREEGVV